MSTSKMSEYSMRFATGQALTYVEEAIKRGYEIANDTRKDERIEKSLCKCCFYFSGRMGGSSITSADCMCCGKTEMYGNTNTDALCLDCAKKHSLCKHCGGDRELRERRRNWPEPSV